MVVAGQSRWRTCGPLTMVAVAVLSVVATFKLPMEVGHIFSNPNAGAKDLRCFFDWTREWAAGGNVYAHPVGPAYPPGSLPILYALVGWLDWSQARLLMGTSILGAGVLLFGIAWRVTAPLAGREALLLGLLLASNNGTGTALGNGQPTMIVVLMVVAGVLILHRSRATWRTDVVAAACLALALVKPNTALPFLWMALVLPHGIRLRPLLLTASSYAALTVLALWVMNTPLTDALMGSARHAVALAETARDPNVHFILAKLGLRSWMPVSSAIALIALGAWIFRHRQSDGWLLMAVAAIVARMWTYHRVYDDILMFVPEVALWRIAARHQAARAGHMAAALLALNALAVIAPGNLTDPPQWLQRTVFCMQAIVWSFTLAFLVRHAKAEPDN